MREQSPHLRRARVTDTRTGVVMAIKRNDRVFRHHIIATRCLRELRMLRYFQHPNIIGIHGLIPPSDMSTFETVWVAIEYMDVGESRSPPSPPTYRP